MSDRAVPGHTDAPPTDTDRGPAAASFDELRLARAYLAGVAEPPAPALVELVERVGPLEAAERIRRGVVAAPVAGVTSARREHVRAASDLRAAQALGVRLLIPEDDDWPSAAFLALDYCGHAHLASPVALWVRGPARLSEVVERSVAIVGARASTEYGNHVARELAHGVVRRGCAVVSGAAYGIDGSAHRGALSASGVTVAVLACGLDRAYPAGHARLLTAISEHGLVVSEYPPGTRPARHRFLVRNRVIAGLAAGTVVVEAGWRSGSRRTAADAGLLGRPVMAVPGPVTSALSVGCHHLLREPGTMAVTRAEEVVEEIGRLGADLCPPRAGGSVTRVTDALSPIGLRVHEALPREGRRSLEALSAESGLPVDLVRAVLPELTRLRLAEQVGSGWRRTSEATRGGP